MKYPSFNPAANQELSFPPDASSRILEATLGSWGLENALYYASSSVLSKHLTRFVMGPIFVWHPNDDWEARLSMSNAANDEMWVQAVKRQWPSGNIDAFLSQVHTPCRKMIDVGRNGASLYLDDLHEVEHDFASPGGGPLLCAAKDLATGQVSLMSRHRSFPFETLGDDAAQFSCHAERMPREGIWGIRWVESKAVSVLCVTEVKTRAAVADGMAYLEAREHIPGVREFRGICMALGVRPYLDSAELYPSGRIDMTLGILGPE